MSTMFQAKQPVKLKETGLYKTLPHFYILICALFILANSVFLYFDNYYFCFLSVLLIVAYFGIFEFEKIYFFAVFFTSLSISLQWLFPVLPFNLSIPSEPLMITLLLIIVLKSIRQKFFENQVLFHPISLSVFAYLAWMFFTSITSSMPVISFKFLLSKIWFIVPLYFFPILLFRKQKNIFLFFGLYIVSFSLVIIYTIKNHLGFGLFDKKAAHFVMKPFYNDHTSYGAILAMYLTIIAGLLAFPKIKFHFKLMLIFALILFSIAVVLSFTRAAWISLVVVIVLLILVLLKIKLRYVIIGSLITISLLFTYRLEIVDKLSKNKQDSSADISKHLQSMSNIATDASNLERINRWNSALKMFKERPFLGWGPGVYMFQYAPYQMARDKTIISTDFGEGGNAHSEYISPLVEQGVPGLVIFLFLIGTTLFTALKIYYNSQDKRIKVLSLASILSLTTYLVHGLLNNYLDTDKASVPFWGIIAIICSLDIYAMNENKNPQLGGAEER